MALINSFFVGRIISQNLWPPRSPDLTSADYFLWGYLKERVYKNKPLTIQDLRANITTETNIINTGMLTHVSENTVKRAQICLKEEGGHFQHSM
jgi:hypothetical protein